MDWSYFGLGAAGSAAVELVTCWKSYHAGRALPRRYRQAGFWVVRTLLALAAGGLVLAYDIHSNPVLAINVGASAPAIFLSLAEGISVKTSKTVQ